MPAHTHHVERGGELAEECSAGSLCSSHQLSQLLARVEHARLGCGRVDTNYLGNFCDRLAVIVHEVDDLAVLRRQASY
jgi:hypothetical protein